MTITIIKCPNCSATFDIKNAYQEIKQEILTELDKIIEKLQN